VRAELKRREAEAAQAVGKCGSLRGYRIHLEKREVPCQPCCDANAEQQRNRRPQRRKAAANTECGQPGGYYKHLRRKQDPCGPCREAHKKELRDYRAKKKVTA